MVGSVTPVGVCLDCALRELRRRGRFSRLRRLPLANLPQTRRQICAPGIIVRSHGGKAPPRLQMIMLSPTPFSPAPSKRTPTSVADTLLSGKHHGGQATSYRNTRVEKRRTTELLTTRMSVLDIKSQLVPLSRPTRSGQGWFVYHQQASGVRGSFHFDCQSRFSPSPFVSIRRLLSATVALKLFPQR